MVGGAERPLTPPRLCGVEVDQTLYGRALQRFLIASWRQETGESAG